MTAESDHYIASKAAQLAEKLEAESGMDGVCKSHGTMSQGVAMLLRLQIEAKRDNMANTLPKPFRYVAEMAQIVGWPVVALVAAGRICGHGA